MLHRSTVPLLVLALLGCSGSGGGGGRAGGTSLPPVKGSPPPPGSPGSPANAAAIHHIVATAQPASPMTGDPVSIEVEFRDGNNMPAPVALDTPVYVRGAMIGLSPRLLTGLVKAGAASTVISGGHIAAVGSFPLTILAAGLQANANVNVLDRPFAGTFGAETQVDAGGPGLAGYSFADLATVDSQVACAFCDQRLQGASHVFVNPSLDAGATFQGAKQADHAPATADAWDASIAVSGSGLVVASWCDQRALENGAVYASVSTDGGRTFGAADTRVDAAATRTSPCGGTKTALATGAILVAWVDVRDAAVGASVFVARSTDQGKTFSETRIDAHAAGSAPWSVSALSLSAAGGDVVVLYIEQQGAMTNVVAATSNDAGVSFTRKNLNGAPSANVLDARLVASGGAFYAAWRDDGSGPATGVFMRRSLDGGVTWDPEVSVGLGAAKAQVSSLAVAAAGANVLVLVSAQDQGATQLVPLVARSTDGGSTFAAPVAIPQGTTDGVRGPAAAANGLSVVASWNETAYASGERASVSKDGGSTFATATKASGSTAADGGFGPARTVLAGGGRFYVLWEESRGSPSSASHLYIVVAQ